MSKKGDPLNHGDRWWENQRTDYEQRQVQYADETDEERDARERKESMELQAKWEAEDNR